MVERNQWLVLLVVLNAVTFMGTWGFTQWADRFPNDPVLSGGWIIACGTAAILGSVGFAALLTLSHKVH